MKNPDTRTDVPSVETLKLQAKRLRTAMNEKETPITQSMALETIAKQWGYRDWNTLSAIAKVAPSTKGWQVGSRVTGRYLGHRISGTLKAVRAAHGGFHHITVVFDEAIDVVESNAFSAFRKQVNATINCDGKTHATTSDGTPHLEVHPA